MCNFFAFILEKNYTGQKNFTRAPPVVPVTNMRYEVGFSLRWRIENKFPDLELESTDLAGHVETPGFGELADQEFFMASRTNTFTLDLPEDLERIVGEGKLVVNLSVNTKVFEGWKEVVFYSDGPTFKFYPERKNWQATEDACVEKGGHLASLSNWKERKELEALDLGGENQVWLGGTVDPAAEGNWSWSDGEEWDRWSDGGQVWDVWEENYPTEDPRKTKLAFYSESKLWRNYNPKAWIPYICKTTVKIDRH